MMIKYISKENKMQLILFKKIYPANIPCKVTLQSPFKFE